MKVYTVFGILCWSVLVSGDTIQSYYKRIEYGSIPTPQGDLVQKSLSITPDSKVACAAECSKQAACRYCRTEGDVCILLGYSGLTGQESSRIFQPEEIVYTEDFPGNSAV